MKRFIYSNYTKAVAAVLFAVSVVTAALVLVNGVAEYSKEKEWVYGFESDFSEAIYFSHLLDAPENVVFNAYHNFYYVDDENETVDGNTPLTPRRIVVNGLTLEAHIEQRLRDLYCADKINYYVKWNDKVYTNCGATSEQELMNAQFYRYTLRDENHGTHVQTSQEHASYSILEELLQFDKISTITVCTNIKESYVAECKNIWDRQAAIVNDTFTFALIYVVAALLLLIYLLCVCGRNKDGEQKIMWVDNIWAEIHIVAVAGIGTGAVVICAILLDDYYSGHFPLHLTNMVVGVAAALASAVVLTSLLSIIRNIKCKSFVESSIICRVIRWAWRTFIKIIKWLYKKCKAYKAAISGALSKKTGIILIGMLLVYTAIIGFFGILAPETPFFFILAILVFGFAAFVVAYRAKDLDEVKKGAGEIRNGNLSYKISELKSEDMKVLARNINEIGEGLEKSVAAKMKAERLKTDLITNVSHDLKTPLTSIISYTELLSETEGLSEEARDYVSIIARKSEKLKTLTQDLFEVSKVQSGNESLVFERLDAAVLINQSLGEHDNEIKQSELPFCVKTDKDLYILADGRKMSRVLGNLIDNALKYAMKHTRVFISAYEKDNRVIIEIKNTSAYPMDFDAEEITGRFVRGDESRTDGGNGLGLAIAKSYTEALGGTFEVVLDGDLFKVMIGFKRQ